MSKRTRVFCARSAKVQCQASQQQERSNTWHLAEAPTSRGPRAPHQFWLTYTVVTGRSTTVQHKPPHPSSEYQLTVKSCNCNPKQHLFESNQSAADILSSDRLQGTHGIGCLRLHCALTLTAGSLCNESLLKESRRESIPHQHGAPQGNGSAT